MIASSVLLETMLCTVEAIVEASVDAVVVTAGWIIRIVLKKYSLKPIASKVCKMKITATVPMAIFLGSSSTARQNVDTITRPEVTAPTKTSSHLNQSNGINHNMEIGTKMDSE